jgi:hypothetical protein
MEINVPFSQFYAAELQAAFERSGRPDETFFARCASVPGINAKYYARIGGNDGNTLARIEGARDIEDCAFSHPKIKSHFVRYYSYTAYNFHFMEVHARSHEKLRDHPELIAQAEQMVADSIQAASNEVDGLIARARQALADNGVTQSVRYGAGPLLVPAEVVSPHCGTYLTLLMKADCLFHERGVRQGVRPCGSTPQDSAAHRAALGHWVATSAQRDARARPEAGWRGQRSRRGEV